MNLKRKLTSLLIILFCCLGHSQSIDNSELKDFLKKHVSNEGFINYEKLVRNKESLSEIVLGLSKLTPNTTWSKPETKAYWINVYNFNMLKLVSDYYPFKSIKYIQAPFNVEFINVNGQKVSLDDVENIIIEEIGDPRMYFALNNTSISAPILSREPYAAETIDTQLEFAVKNFINDPSKNYFSKTTNEAILSPLFKWHASHFENLSSFINKYLEGKQITNQTEITYSSFDWTLSKESY
ncbi:DUF547 domain-containing protein [Tamlana sp. 2_MG-2023]|uniref:DUF547 domain-containing protein n=1 Tax=unclassified Tamlana TaxID=2614803 RepID=UPI0026E1DAD9|nr:MULTISPECIES: DUF547 domain-containing protein [unclassified Tamlana]MDO6760380.1 DUF547 domain-containing protein [Tamlana sp. 2_MG-2023]MDO6789922.1 DUF547 domain-containing protein [Tamlana sp. 1_MG-2023]